MTDCTNCRNAFFLPDNYKENDFCSGDRDGEAFWPNRLSELQLKWQIPVYKAAQRIANSNGCRTILDVGCGSGHKLVRHFQSFATTLIGMDQESGIRIVRELFPEVFAIAGDFDESSFWTTAGNHCADLIICADVIEHVREPVLFLRNLGRIMSDQSILVLSSPDRDRLENCSNFGPPRNPRHVREWTPKEMIGLLLSNGFALKNHQHVLPRSYNCSVQEIARQVWRFVHAKALPDRRSCMVFVLSKVVD